MLQYVAVSQSMCGEGDRVHTAASGIAAYLDRRLVRCIKDITPDHREAEQLAEKLNRFGASLIHFHDIVEDYVAEH